MKGLMVVGAGRSAISGVQRIVSGDILGGLLDIGQSCFTREMLIKEKEGKKRAEFIKKGDLLWSRCEFDPHGPIELKEVEEVFERVARIYNVHVAGQMLRTTDEHPFWVLGKGWTPAIELQIGDMVLTDSGLLVPVEGVADSGQVETVYNWRVADHHTYFVSATVNGVSIWAHNASRRYGGGAYEKVRKTNRGGQVHHTPAASISPYSRTKGPAVWMSKADHRKTASWGSSKAAQKYRDRQSSLIKKGKLRQAIGKDIKDIRSKFGNKYDTHINQMLQSLGFPPMGT